MNYRAKLWGPKAAEKALSPLLPDCTLAIMTVDDAANVFGIKGEPDKVAASDAPSGSTLATSKGSRSVSSS